uniref:Peroxidase 21 n=1 Tax=Aegilops tauschii TaxID=37682 RepID=R7W9D9_AEGTA
MGLSSSLAPVASALLFLCCFTARNAAAASGDGGGGGGLRLNYYSESCPRAEEIVKEQVRRLYEEHGNTAVSWLRAPFPDRTAKYRKRCG